MGAKYTESQKKASLAYQKNNASIRVWLSEEKKEVIKKKAEAAGKTLTQYTLDALEQQNEMTQISATTIGNLITAHIEGNEEMFLSFANFIAETYEKAGEERKARIIRKRIDGTYKDEPQVSLDDKTTLNNTQEE